METVALNDIFDQMYLIDSLRIFYPKATEEECTSQVNWEHFPG